MEGKQVTIISMETKSQLTTKPKSGGGLSVQIGKSGVKQNFGSANPAPGEAHSEESKVHDLAALTTEPLKIPTLPEKHDDQPVEGAEQAYIDAKRKLITDYFDQLGKDLDPKTKERLKEDYLDDFLNDDNENGSDLKDTLSDVKRLLILIIRLLVLLILNPDKELFSGKDLHLEDKAPDAEGDDALTRMMNGKTPQESWDGFKNEVENIENVPFHKLMEGVLSAHKKNSVKTFKKKDKESKKSGFSKLMQKMGIFRRQPKVAKRG